ncbi:MAG TPA: rhomboid family intramembrane serine protease [Anaeromyxobacter sp.]
MAPRSAPHRLEPFALAAALASPLPMLALAPDGWVALGTALVFVLPVAGIWALFRFLRRGRPRPPRPTLVLPPLGPPPPQARAAPFRVRRGARLVLEGTWDDVVAAARAGRLGAFDEVAGGGVAVAPADLSELLPFVPSRWEARVRRAYLGYLGVSLAAAAAGIAVLAWGRSHDPGLADEAALVVLLFAAALLPLLLLRRDWRRVREARARGLVPEAPPRRTLGSATLDAALAGPAPATRVMLVLVVVVSALALLLPEDDLLLKLAKDNDAIRRGEVWRLLTAGLVHGGGVHLLLNASVLANVGGIVERLLGGRRMLAVLWGGVLAGSLASFATNPHPSVGISGGLFALVGALLAVGLRHRRVLPSPARRMLVRAPIEIIILNIALGLALPIIDNAAHLGGLAGGILLGLALGVRPEIRASLGAAGGAPAAPR